MKEPITKAEIEVAKSVITQSLKTCVDIYLDYLDGHPVQEGADIDFVFRTVWGANYEMLKHEVGWATLLFIRNQIELTRKMMEWQMQEIARHAMWRSWGSAVWSSGRCFLKLGKLWLRHYSPIPRPMVGLADFVVITSYTGKRGL